MGVSPDPSPQAAVGHVDVVTTAVVAGWAAVPQVARPLTVEILLGERVIGTCRANVARPDLLERPGIHPNAGFRFACDLASAGYGARVFARAAGTAQFLPGSGRFVHPISGQRLFFVHIPKTAGTTVNAIAHKLFQRVQEHLENFDWQDTAAFADFNFLSGHLSSRGPIERYRPKGFRFFTMFREPAEQFVSHLRWLRHYAKYPPEEARRLIDPTNLEIAQALDAAPTDLRSQVLCLRALLAVPRLALNVRPLFDNSLTRYMVPIGAAKHADTADADRAIRALADFELIGLQSHFAESLAMLDGLTGLDWSAHAGRWDNLSPDTEVIGEATAAAGLIEELIWSDLLLYREASTRFFRARLATAG